MQRNYRAKRIDNGEWVEGSLIGDNVIAEFDKLDVNTYRILKVHPDSVGQFTGMLDKNGAKIFEGMNLSCGNVTYKVIFSDGCYQLEGKSESHLTQNRCRHFEIINE